MNLVQGTASHKFFRLGLVILAAVALAGRAAPAAFASGRVAAGVREADPPVSTPSVSITGKVTTGSNPSWLDYVPFAGFAAAVLSLWVIWGQLKSTDRAARRERAAETAAAWMDRDFRQIASSVMGFLDLQDVDDCLRKVRAWVSAPNSRELCLPGASRTPTVSKNDVTYVLSVFEDIAVRYNTNAGDREWIELLLGAALVSMFETAMWFVVFFRAWEESSAMNTEIEKMVRHLREARHASMRDSLRLFHNARLVRKRHWQTKKGTYGEILEDRPQPVRIICLPRNPGTATDQAWAEASRLSACLSSDHEGIRGYRKARNNATRDDVPEWRAIIFPTSTDTMGCECDEQLSQKLNSYLSSLPGVSPRPRAPIWRH